MIFLGSIIFSGVRLTNIKIPASITTIGYSAFYGSNITKIRFEENSQLDAINTQAFENSKLSDIILSNSLTHIGTDAFLNTVITSIYLPKSISSIDSGGLSTSQLSEIRYFGTMEEWGKIALNTSWATGVTEIICSDGVISLE